MASRSRTFQSFLESFEAEPSDRRYSDDYNVAALAALGAAERQEAETLLLRRLAERPSDDRVPAALAVVGSPASLDPLREALQNATRGFLRLRIASALGKLDPAFDPVPIWLELLRGSDISARALAAYSLASAPKSLVEPALLEALGDSQFIVRVNAFSALLHLHGINHLSDPPRSRLRTTSTRLLSHLDSVVGPAVEEARALMAELQAGRTPDELGLADLPTREENAILDRVLASLRRDAEQPLDLDALGRLEGYPRRFIECLLLGELDHGHPSTFQAVAALSVREAVAPLRELLARGEGDARLAAPRAAAALALERLASDGTGGAILEAEGTDEARRALAELDADPPDPAEAV